MADSPKRNISAGLAMMAAAAAAGDAIAADYRGDPERGEKAFAKCLACHTIEPGKNGLPGPNLRGVVGRPAASLESFTYSDAMADAAAEGLVWTPETLSDFVREPEDYLPGTAMNFLGVPRTRERMDIIAFLESLTTD